MRLSSPRDKVKTSNTPEIRGFQTFKAEFAVYLLFIGEKIVVAPCGSCGAATFFIHYRDEKISGAHLRKEIHAALAMLFYLPCTPF